MKKILNWYLFTLLFHQFFNAEQKNPPNCNLRTLIAEILNPYRYDNANYAVLIAALGDHSNCQAVWVSWFLFSRSLPV